MRPRAVLVACLAAIVATSVILLVPATRGRVEAFGTSGSAVVSADNPGRAKVAPQAAPPLPVLRAPADPASVTAATKTSFFGWAFLDTATGKITGSANSVTGTNSTESMVKAWIASDYLRQQAAAGLTPSDATMTELTNMIIHSDDDMAQKYYTLDGANADMQRMIDMCGLTNTKIFPYWWSRTQMSPQDAVKYGECVASGKAAGTKWTPWILDTMKHVVGGVNDQVSEQVQGGHWGIIDGLPANLVATTSIKNGWTQYSDGWHVNCLAINPAWILNVMVRVPGTKLQPAADICASVARQLTVTPEI